MSKLSEYEEAVKCLRTKTTAINEMEELVMKLEQEGKLEKVITMMDTYLLRAGIQEHELGRLSVIHVAGSKGKGSTSAFTESIIRHHGYKTGMFISPHLNEIREYIRINGRPLSKDKFCLYFWEVFKKLENTTTGGLREDGGQMPTYLEVILIMGMRAFLAEDVDVVVLEVGKGGRGDRTNFVRNPVVCGITPLVLEHTDTLGKTLEKIAWHKAGIIKPGRPVFTVPQKPAAMKVILDTAKQNKSPLSIVSAMPQSLLDRYRLTLGLGEGVQLQNAALAVQLFKTWKSYVDHAEQPDPISATSTIQDILVLQCESLDPNIIKGLAECKLDGRTQAIRREKVSYYVDFAHTQDSIKNLVQWFRKKADEEAASLKGNVARVLVFFCTTDKDHVATLSILKDAGFTAAGFSVNQISHDEPLGYHSDQRFGYSEVSSKMEQLHKLRTAWGKLNGTNSVNEGKTRDLVPTPDSQVFDCALQALVWATQGKDPGLAACMTAPKDLLPPAPAAMKNADHIQVVVTGSAKLVGVALSLLTPNMND